MELTQVTDLIAQVGAINAFYSEETTKSGENFNVFRILKLHSAEVRLHSSFIAELLNPKGSHGQKDIFLRLFVEKFQFKNNNFITKDAIVEIEKHFGFLDDDSAEGGRVDIIITDKSRSQIVIENKIYAPDQKNQLVRYNRISPNADLFYLTLSGREPLDYSKGVLKMDIDFKCISYKFNIIEWLLECKESIFNLPIITETITQYINLIKHLTNQTINDSMKNEIASLITSNVENVEATFTLLNSIVAIKSKILQKLNLDLNKLAVKYNLETSGGGFDIAARFNGVLFFRKDWEYGTVGFGLQNYDSDLIYGIIANQPEDFPDSLRTDLIKIKPPYSNSTEWWPIYFNFESPFNNWNDDKEVWISIYNGSIVDNIEYKLNEILNLLDSNKIQL